MKRTVTGLCVAVVLSFATAVFAQQTTTPQPATGTNPQTSAASSPGNITLTGCLQRGDDGNFSLTNVQMDSASTAGSAPTGTSGATATAGATATTPGATSAAPGATATAGANTGAAMNWNLRGGTDLEKHVGHRIAVTGRSAMGAASTSATAGATAPGATAGTSTGATGGAATGVTGGATATAGSKPMASARTLEVQSIKMISANCP